MPRKTIPTSTTGTTTNRPEIFRLLKDEHQTVKGLFLEFEEANTKKKPDTAFALATTIINELEGHAAREEHIIYPHLRRMDLEMFFEAQTEHRVATILMIELKRMAWGDEEFLAKMKVLRDVVEYHIREEESDVFAELRELDAEVLRECAETWKEQQIIGERQQAGAERQPVRQRAA